MRARAGDLHGQTSTKPPEADVTTRLLLERAGEY